MMKNCCTSQCNIFFTARCMLDPIVVFSKHKANICWTVCPDRSSFLRKKGISCARSQRRRAWVGVGEGGITNEVSGEECDSINPLSVRKESYLRRNRRGETMLLPNELKGPSRCPSNIAELFK